MTTLNTDSPVLDAPPSRLKYSPRAFEAAVDIYARWEIEREKTPFDRVVGAEFRSRKYLNSGERRWVSAVLYSAVRFKQRDDFLLAKMGWEVNAENRIKLHTAEMEGTDEQVSAAVAALPGKESRREYLRITQSIPEAMADELEKILGKEALEAGAALNQQAPITLRVNPLVVPLEKARKGLADSAFTRFSPWGLELPGRTNINDLPGFKEGWFEVQEEASQLAVLLTDARPGQTVVEVGSGAGGKTLALAALIQNKGRIVALDNSPQRMEELHKRADRAKAENIQTLLLPTNAEGVWLPEGKLEERMQKLVGNADIVLVDAPCTGSGTLRRSPDTKWREMDMTALQNLQLLLLEQSAPFVKEGGCLIYVTCSFERAQNEGRINAFLKSDWGAQFEVEPALPRLQSSLAHAAKLAGRSPKNTDIPELTNLFTGNYLRTFPHRHNLDAFFAAVLRRKLSSV